MKKVVLFSVVGILIDQLIKYIIDTQMLLNSSLSILSNFFHITYVRNYGAAFSILDGNRIFFILIALSALVIIYLIFLKNKKLNKFDIATYALLISGITGNLIDRACRGFVIDYLDFNLWGYHYPIFNFADICIVTSVVLIIITILKEEKREKNRDRRG